MLFYFIRFRLKILFIFKDKIKRTLGEGTFGKVVEVKDSYE